MKRVYIAGPLNSNACGYIQNMHKMIVWAELVRKAGFSVFVPGLDFLCGVVHGNWEYHDYFDNSQPWLEAADALFVVPDWQKSSGVRKEIDRAMELGIPVFFDIDDLKAICTPPK